MYSQSRLDRHRLNRHFLDKNAWKFFDIYAIFITFADNLHYVKLSNYNYLKYLFNYITTYGRKCTECCSTQ